MLLLTLLFIGNPKTIIFIIFVLVLFFGAKRIPELFRGVGQGVREFKDATNEQPRAPQPTPGQPPYGQPNHYQGQPNHYPGQPNQAYGQPQPGYYQGQPQSPYGQPAPGQLPPTNPAAPYNPNTTPAA